MNVQNTIANAKLITDNTRAELKKQITDLKQEMQNIVDTANKKVATATETITAVVDNKKSNTVRY